MRRFAFTCAVLFFLSLGGATVLPDPLWVVALYLTPLMGALVVVSLGAAVLETALAARFRPVAAFVGAALTLAVAIFSYAERAPGTLDAGMPMEHLVDKGISVAVLGFALGGLVLSFVGLSSPWLPAQVVGGVGTMLAAVALGATAKAVGLPFVSPLTLGLAALAGVLFLISSHLEKRRDAAEAGPSPHSDER